MNEKKGGLREPVKEGRILCIRGKYFRFGKCIGLRGSSSLVYEGVELMDPEGRKPVDEEDRELPGVYAKRVIIKEFYPETDRGSFDIRRNEDGALSVSSAAKGNRLYAEKRRQFTDAERNQFKLSNSEQVSEIVPRLYFCGDYGDSRYVCSERNDGFPLDEDKYLSLEEKLIRARAMGQLIEILHKSGYVLLDFKPENFFWSEIRQALYLVDLDSVVPYGEEASDSRIYRNDTYRTPQIGKYLEGLEMYRRGSLSGAELKRLKECLICPQINVYNLGQYLYYLLFGKVPVEVCEADGGYEETGDLKQYDTKHYEETVEYRENSQKNMDRILQGQYPKLVKEGLYRDISGIISKCLNNDVFTDNGYRAEDFVKDIDEIQTRLKSNRIKPKAKYTAENCSALSFRLLEEFPIYDYGWTPENRILDVAIVGNHVIWESMFTAVFSAAQMLDTTLNIRLVMGDAGREWEKFISQRTNLPDTVSVRLNGKEIQPYREDNRTVAAKLANVWLYDISEQASGEGGEPDAVRKTLEAFYREKGLSTYFILLEETEQWNRALAEALAKLPGEPGKKCFAGYLCSDESRIVKGHSLLRVSPINVNRILKEKGSSDRIYELGFYVHRRYYRMTVPWAGDREILADYKKKRYNIEASERAALNLYYKMKSIGLDAKSTDASLNWYDTVLADTSGAEGSLFSRLLWQEHLSWTAYMVAKGHRGVKDIDELKGYLYEGDNNWKNIEDKNHWVHPCICSSTEGYHIKPEMWSKYPDIDTEEKETLDELDRWSLAVYSSVREKLQQNFRYAKGVLEAIHEIVRESRSINGKSDYLILEEKFHGMERVFRIIMDEEPVDADKIWSESLREFEDQCERTGIRNKVMCSQCGYLDAYMKPAIWFREKHDFKKFDEAILLAAPEILDRDNIISKSNRQEIVIYKAESGEMWENIFSSAMIHRDGPDKLIIIPERSCETERLQKKYQELADQLRLKTRVEAVPVNKLRESSGIMLLDLTGVSPMREKRLQNLPFAGRMHDFVVSNMKYRPLDEKDVLIRKLNLDSVTLSVEQILRMNGIEEREEDGRSSVTKLEREQYIILWNWYRKTGNEKLWRTFRQVLRRIQKKQLTALDVTVTSEQAEDFETEPVEGKILRESGLLEVLYDLQGKGLLELKEYPGEEEYSGIAVTTNRRKLMERFQEAVRLVREKPGYYNWSLTVREEKLHLKNDTLWVDEFIPYPMKTKRSRISIPFRGTAGARNRERGCENPSDKNRRGRGLPETWRNNQVHSEIKSEKNRNGRGLPEMAEETDEASECRAICAVFSILPEEEKNKLFRSLSVGREKAGIHLKFRYVSDAVRKVFEHSGTILGALIYHECRNARIFDSIRYSGDFLWEDGSIEKEIDVIGTKNSRTYLIAAKTTPIDDDRRREILEHNYHFGIQNRMILVCSHPSSGREGGRSNGNVRRLLDRVNDGCEENKFILGSDEIDRPDPADPYAGRRLIIADKIREVIDKTEKVYREIDEES